MLGYYGLIHVLISAFGNGAVVVRLPAAIASAATVALTSMIGLRLWGRMPALVAGLLAAVSLPLVYWGQDARGYTPMIAFVAASFLLLVIALQQDRPSRWLWAGYVAVTTLSVYMGLEAVLVLPAQVLLLIWYRNRALWLLSALIVSGLLCIPLAVLATGRGSAQIFWIPLPDAFTIKQVLLTLSSAGLEPQFYTSTSDVLRVLTEVLVGGALGLIVWQIAWRQSRAAAWKPVLAASWLILPGIVAYVFSELGKSMFEARYLLLSLPGLALLLAWLIVGVARLDFNLAPSDEHPADRDGPAAGDPDGPWARRRSGSWLPPAGRRTVQVLAIALVVGLIVLRSIQLAPSYGVSTEPWRSVTARVLAHSRPGDCIAFYPLDARMPFRYYLPTGATPPHPVLPVLPWNQVRPFVEAYATLSPAQIDRLPASCSRMWLVSSHQGRNDGTAVGARHYQRFLGLSTAIGQEYFRSKTTTYGREHLITVVLYSHPLKPGGGAAF